MNSETSFGFKMKSGGFTWLAVGICHKDKILSNNYSFTTSIGI